MGRYFALAFLVVVALASAFVGYGLYLNTQSSSYLAAVQSRTAIRVAGSRVKNREIHPAVEIAGINLETSNITDVISQVDGTLVNLMAEVGNRVTRGQKLCELENPLIKLKIQRAETDVDRADVNLQLALTNLDRSERLHQERAISLSELDLNRSKLQAAESELEASRVELAEIQQQQEFQIVTAPMDGDVLIVYHKTGAYLPRGSPLMLIGDFSTLTFSTLIPDWEAANLVPLDGDFELVLSLDDKSKGFSAHYTGGYRADTGFPAHIVKFSPPLEEDATHRNVAWIVRNNHNVLEPGFYTQAVVRSVNPTHALAAPVAALLDSEDMEFHVVDAAGKLARRKIVSGVYDKKYVEVVKGLKDGDIVVESNVDDLRPGTAIRITRMEDDEEREHDGEQEYDGGEREDDGEQEDEER